MSTRDFTNDGPITLDDLTASGVDEAIVSASQAREIYQQLQHAVSVKKPVEFEGGSFRSRGLEHRSLLITPRVDG